MSDETTSGDSTSGDAATGDATTGDNGAPPRRPTEPYGQAAPIGGMVRDPRETREAPSFGRYLRRQTGAAVEGTLVGLGVRRARTPEGDLLPRAWNRLAGTIGTIIFVLLVWTSVHIVAPGTVGVPVTLGHPGKPLRSGFHITLPFTWVYSMSIRTQNYTMSSIKGEGAKGVIDDSIPVLGADGGSANVNATVLYRLEPAHATEVYRTLGRGYTNAIVRPSARTCIRTAFTQYGMVDAATTAWGQIEQNVTTCLKNKIESNGIDVLDFQLREVALSVQLQNAVNSKVAAQQKAEQQKFERSTAEQVADITRIQALATADEKTILVCGGHLSADGRTVIPNDVTTCPGGQISEQYLQYKYIQALQALAASPNTSTLVLPFDKNLTPLLQIPSGSSSTTTK